MLPVTLTDGVVTLGAPTDDDVPTITRLCQDPDVQAWTTVPSPYAEDDARGFVAGYVRSGWAEDTVRTWAIRSGAQLCGMVGLERRSLRSAEVGYWLGPEHRGRGLLTRALGLVLDHAFDPGGMDVDRVEWRAYAGNWASWRAAWRHGFRLEGALRLGGKQRGVRRDEWVGSLLRDDPREPVAPWPAATIDLLADLPDPSPSSRPSLPSTSSAADRRPTRG